jgi:hypothetical protein
VTQGFKCADDGGSACSLESFGEAGLEGAAEGAVGGVLGEFGGALLGKLAPRALDAVGGLFSADATGEAVGAGLDEAAGDAGGGAGDGGEGGAASGGAGGGDDPVAGTEEDTGGSCTVPHSFTGGTGVLMADGTSRPIDEVKAGDKVEDSVPGQKGAETHTVQKVIVTRTDHDFVDVTIAPVKKTVAGRAKAGLASAGKKARPRAGVGLAAAVTAAAVLTGGHAGAAAAHTPPVQAAAPATAGPAAAVRTAAPAGNPSAAAPAGATLTTTFHHPFYDETRAAFTDAQYLHAGDILQTPDGTAQVTAVRLFHANTTTYDLTIDGLHTYYVEAGTIPVLVHNCGTDPEVGSGKAYSVAYETKISEGLYPGRSRGAHFQAAKRALIDAMDSDPGFAASTEDLIPGIRDSLVGPRGGISRTSPSSLWTWHHAADDGLMQLVPRIQHEAHGDLQNVFHPGGVGGYSIWG